ncbi:MAG: hypothetical protein V1888_03730 [archaeon]
MKIRYLLLSIFSISFASASECSITNLGSCLVEKFFEFLLYILNAPIQSLLTLTYDLLTEPVNIGIFSEIWGIVVYILSMMYGLILLYVGFRFIIAGHSDAQREKAKSSLANIIIMMVLVQSSYFIYSLAIQLTSSITAVVFNMVQREFFLLTVDNVTNIGLELTLVIPYLMAIVLTLIILTLRYMIVSVGVVFFAIGVFFYFIEPLNSYGKLIINFLFATMTLTFFYSIVFLASAKLLDVGSFQNYKILVMIGAFSFVNIITLIALAFILIKSALKVSSPVVRIMSLVQGV